MEGDELLSVKTFHPQIIKTVKGSTENLQKSFFLNYGIRKTKRALSLVDSTIALLIVTPLIVGFWSGTWNLIDLHPNVFPPYETFFLGATCHLCFAIVREGLQNLIQFEDKSWPKVILAFAIRRIYTYFFAVISILNWRSGWVLYDIWMGLTATTTYKNVPQLTLYLNYMVLGFGAVTLICLRSVRNLLAAPFVIGLDTKTSAFDFPTRFKKKMEEKTLWYIMDCIFSVFVIGTLVVFVWRGAWVLVDLYLFPENNVFSSWASLIIGYGSVIVAFLLQPIMRWICDRVEGIPRLLIADLFLFFSFFGTINLWRGIWNLLNLYFIPDNIELSSWISHWTCLVLLILLKCSNTLLVRGVYIDAEEPAGKCVVFPIYYLRLIFQHERIKKINKKCESEAVARKKLEMEGIIPPCTCGADIKNYIANNGNEKKHHIQVEKKV